MSPIYATPTLVPRCFISKAQRVTQGFDAGARSTERSAKRMLGGAVSRGDHQGVTVFVTDVRTGCAQGVVRAHEIDFDGAAHVRRVAAEDRRVRLDTGIGDDDVDASQLLSDVVDAARYLLEVGDVAQLPRRAAAGSGDLLEKFRLEAEQSHGRTTVVQASGQRRTDICGQRR